MISEMANRIATTRIVGPGQTIATMPRTMPTIEVTIREVRSAPIISSGKNLLYAVAKVMVEAYPAVGPMTPIKGVHGTNWAPAR
ncbi:Uncharacterised protein [Gordonia paraffinivorans]|uniref:Uncharacterized protein n=1 Tax=Gordonia paraffinivorans TaxID=175628 RepID=A0ABD7V4U6_9ACTN|nr:Uncharacterised protein [Gordonia paraffinivorans]